MKRIIISAMMVLVLVSCGGKSGSNGKTPEGPKTEDERAKENNKTYVTFSIYDDLGDDYKTLYLYIDAKPEDRKYIWIDKNSNGKKDAGEAIEKFGLTFDRENELKFTTNKELKLYGKVTHLGGRANFRFSKFSSGTNKEITYLDLAANFMSDIDISNLSSLQYLSLRNNVIEALDLTKLPKLKVLDLAYSNYFETDLTKCSELEYLDLSSRYYSGFSLSNYSKLHTLLLRDNWLEEFDAGKLSALVNLDVSGNVMKQDELEALYRSLPNRKGKVPGLLLVKGNPGVPFANHQLAIERNWKVDDTAERLEPKLDRDNMPIVKW